MIGNTITFRIENTTVRHDGIVIDKIIVPKKIYEHNPTTEHSSYNPVYKQTVEVTAYLVRINSGDICTVYTENILNVQVK